MIIMFHTKGKSVTLVIPKVGKGASQDLRCLTLYVILSDSTFSGGGDNEVVQHCNGVLLALADGDRGKQTHQSQMPRYSHLEGTGSSVGTAEGSAGARCSFSSLSSSSFSTSSSSLSPSDDSLS
ncbi:hypothetical protein Tco_0567658 [Tanacetum coccineum]